MSILYYTPSIFAAPRPIYNLVFDLSEPAAIKVDLNDFSLVCHDTAAG